jgi:exosortase K
MQLLLILAAVLGLKLYYSAASVNELRWILTPTTLLVELVTGRSFVFESHAGYMSSDHTFLIAASCAGVNFLITAFLMLSLQDLWRNQLRPGNFLSLKSWLFLPAAAVISYVATIVTNTVRISVALQMQQTPLKVSWLNANQLHRLEGVFVYFGFLLLLYVISEKTIFRRLREGRRNASGASSVFRHAVFPLLIYYVTTLGLPLANGAYRQPSFLEHSLFVLLAPLAVVVLVSVVAYFRTIGRRSTLGTESELLPTG